MRWDSPQIAELVQELIDRYEDRDLRVALYDALTFRRSTFPDSKLGTFLPAPLDKSQLIQKFRTTEISDAASLLAADMTANKPNIQVAHIPATNARVKTIDKVAADFELGMNAIWDEADKQGAHQDRIAWNQLTQGVGWYLVLPSDVAFGMPDRRYFEDLTDDEVQELIADGKIVPTDDPDKPFKESADVWRMRRKAAMEAHVTQGRSLFAIESLAAAEVYPDWDQAGLKAAMVRQSIPAALVQPGGALAQAAGRAAVKAGRLDSDAVDDWGLFLDENGHVVGGTSQTRDRDWQDPTNGWMLSRIFTRDEMYYYVSGGPTGARGTIVFATKHNFRRVPLFDAAGTLTGSDDPAERYLPHLDGLLSMAPMVNQFATLLSNAVSYNTTPRRYIALSEGGMAFDDDGAPIVIERDRPIGMSPEELAVVHGGEVKDLTIDAVPDVLQALDFVYKRLVYSVPTEAETGAGSLSGPAWSRRQAQQASGKRIAKLIQNHARAVKGAATFMAEQLRELDTPFMFIAPPGMRKDAEHIRGVIEVDPSELITIIEVQQSPSTPEQKTINAQVGSELLEAGRITMQEFQEVYLEKADPIAAERDLIKEQVKQIILFGNSEGVHPNSLVMAIVRAVQGDLTSRLVQTAPRLAQALADPSAASLAGEDSRGVGAGGGAVDAAGIAQPSAGMPATMPGMAVPGQAPPPAPPVVG